MSSLDNFLKKHKLDLNNEINENKIEDLLNIMYYTNIEKIKSSIDKLKNAIDSLSSKVKGRYRKRIYKRLFESPGSLNNLIDNLIIKNITSSDEKEEKLNNIKELNNNSDLKYLNDLCNYNTNVYKELVKDRGFFKLGSKTILENNLKYGLPYLLGGISNGVKMFDNEIFQQYFQSFDHLIDNRKSNKNASMDDYLIYKIIKEKDPIKFITLLINIDDIENTDLIQDFTSTKKRKLRNEINNKYYSGGGYNEQEGGFSKIDSLFVGNKTDKSITKTSNKKKRFKLRKKIVRKNYKMIKKIYLFFFQFIIIKLFYFTGELIKKFKDNDKLKNLKWDDNIQKISSGQSRQNKVLYSNNEILNTIFNKDNTKTSIDLGKGLLNYLFRTAPSSS